MSAIRSKHLAMGNYFYIFVLPALILYFVFFLYPFIQGIGYSFLNWNGLDPEIPVQMDIKMFDILVEKNIPVKIAPEKLSKILKKIKNSELKEKFRASYFLDQYEIDYIIRTDLEEIDYINFNKMLREIGYRGILSEWTKKQIYNSYTKNIEQNMYVLKKDVSMFKRGLIKNALAKVDYENIRNVGFDNYFRMFKDPKFIEVIKFTVFFTLFNVLFINVLGLLLALALDSQIRSRNFLRTLFFLPNVLSLIIAAYIWSFIYREVFSNIYNFTGWELFKLNWLTDLQKAPWAIVLTSVWQGVGYIMVIYLAGLQTIPTDIMEVASIDGANGLKKFFSITLPLLFPSITICFFITLTNSLKTFEIMLALTDGSFNTTSFVLNVYMEAFRRNRVGYSTAQAIFLLFIIMAISSLQLAIMKKKEIEY